MYPIILTGGIGSGKTTVANIFKTQHGIDVICADQCAKEVIKLPEVIQTIKQSFNSYIVNPKGQINRTKLRQLISQNNEARIWLNNIMHPNIRKNIEDKLKQSQSIYTIVDIPLLNQENVANYPYLKKIICVYASLETRIDRIIERDNQTNEQALAIIQSQITDYERHKFSDFIINNNEDLIVLMPKIKKIHQELRLIAIKSQIPKK